ncbi:NEDD4-binding protein 2 [Larimichthys crocea]|uniref:NEDD4-binding protein 2 n=1 Tax=Larimichthys crocea TaxID=215358 RepID=UPI000F5FBBFA|nr:NEDD4-binding protein 2 [Larimichthys crocea]
MPRRKKNGQSPARVPGGGPPEGGSLGHSAGYRLLPQGFDGAMASSSVKEEIVTSMQEMFSHLDPEVIYIVLSECDFKVENAMDSLLELSRAAEVEAPTLPPPPVSGFERTAAALLSPRHFSEPRPDTDSSRTQQQELLPSSPPSANLLTEELDLLVDQELQTLTTQRDVKEARHTSQYLSSFPPPPPFPQQVLPELLQTSMQPGSRGPSGALEEHISGTSSPLDELSTWEDDTAGQEQQQQQQQQSMVDLKHLMAETPADKPKPPLDLAASGRPSAFQVYKKQEPSHTLSDTLPSKGIVGGARSKMVNQEQLGYTPPPWNLQAPVFSPRIHGNQGPTFITPVAPNWSSQPWLSQGPVGQAPLKPSAIIPKSWAMPAPRPPAQSSRLRLEGKVLVLLRGAPGSGKSTLARAFVEHNPGGVKLSTDDYFTRHGEYWFDPSALGEAHEWNHQRAKEAFERGANPIIIDNTNLQGWEMRPYVVQALKHGYKILFREPDTWWKNKPRELERRTKHKVPVDKIRRMLDGYERYVTIQSIMGSQRPPLENRGSQLVSSGAPCPDLVGPPGLTDGCKKSQLFSSLPDVSSIGRSSEVGQSEDGAHKSTESLNFQPTQRLTENPEVSNRDDDIDLGDLDSELDAQLELNHPIGDQRIPDCIVESVMNEDHRGEEVPVAFSESIGQRVRRERPSRRSAFDRLQPADLVKDTNPSESEAKEKEKTKEEDEGGEKGMLDFVGDWPSEGSLGQRQVRRRERHKEGNSKEAEGVSQEDKHTKEFQKLLDLIQTGVPPDCTGSSCSSSFSLISEEEVEKEEEAGGRFEESSEKREESMSRVNSARGELPDCVLDWKAAESCKIRELRIDDWEGLKTENKASATTGDDTLETVELKSTDPTDPHTTVEANVCHDGAGSLDVEVEVGTEPCSGPADVDVNDCTENESKAEAEISEACQSPVCEGSVEAESGAFSGGSQERKQRQGRRSGKQCKLALTFTQNRPASPPNTFESPNTAAEPLNSTQNTISADVEPNLNTKTSLSLEPNLDLLTETHLQPPSPCPLADEGFSTQTEPQDFALLWRLNRQDGADNAAVTGDVKVLSGDSSRFVPELSSVVSAAVAVNASGHREVPYRVVHEKGTQVEEKEFGVTQDRLESLRILSRHFKLVSFDTLEDLYDKCYQDLEWTTNLLLDSGERFFRDEDGVEEDLAITPVLCGALGKAEDTTASPDVSDGHHSEDRPTGIEEGTQQSTSGTVNGSDQNSNKADARSFGDAAHSDTAAQTDLSLPQADRGGDAEHKVASEADLIGGAWGGSSDDGVIIEESRVESEEEMASMDTANQLLLAELDKMEREERAERRLVEERRSRHLDIQSVELKLPTEVALQLTELFGPVGVDPGSCSTDDYAVQMDLNLAKLLHQKWKETIQERQRQATLSFHLLQESSVHWGDSQSNKSGPRTQPAHFLISADGYSSMDSQSEASSQLPFMDHWNVSRPHISLRDIIKEEQALQENVEKTRQNRAELDRRDGATLLKENQLYALFPNIDRHFLQDIFRDNNYSLTQTELFLRSILDEEPVKTVVAPEAPRLDHQRAASKEREKRQKPPEAIVPNYQDTEDPEYEDFRAEASLHRSRQLESFSKAAEAYKQGRKDVASFYAQQGQLHGKRMHEANRRAAVQIFERRNSSLLPSNILDLHGLHVDEALEHLAQVLEDKTTDCEQGLCRPQLSVITGRGNHSLGGVARIRPAVIDYLTSKHYRFTEPKPGLVLVSLK